MVELQRRDRLQRADAAGIQRFPFVVGRGDADLKVVAPGIWDRHFSVQRGENHSFVLVPEAEAPVSVGGDWVQQSRVLKNGDRIGCGAVEFIFRLSATRPKSLVWPERITWILLAGLLGLQLALAFGWPS